MLVTLLSLFRTTALATEAAEIERQVKAAYVYKFASYVDWPDRTFVSNESPLVIGILGADALADELAHVVTGRTTNGRPVLVRKLRNEDSIANLNVLFIGHSHSGRLGEILATAKQQSMLTVTESADALAAGSMINFVLVDGKVRFEIAPKAAGLRNMKISALLLAAAYKVALGAS